MILHSLSRIIFSIEHTFPYCSPELLYNVKTISMVLNPQDVEEITATVPLGNPVEPDWRDTIFNVPFELSDKVQKGQVQFRVTFRAEEPWNSESYL